MMVTDEVIAKRAFDIWEREGRPQGRDQEHWFRAECELRTESMKEQEARGVLTNNPSSLRAAATSLTTPAKRGMRPGPNRAARSRA